MNKKENLFPRCVDRKHDCYWFMDDGTCALLSTKNKHCSFHKTALEVQLSHEKREQLVRERGKTR